MRSAIEGSDAGRSGDNQFNQIFARTPKKI